MMHLIRSIFYIWGVYLIAPEWDFRLLIAIGVGAEFASFSDNPAMGLRGLVLLILAFGYAFVTGGRF